MSRTYVCSFLFVQHFLFVKSIAYFRMLHFIVMSGRVDTAEKTRGFHFVPLLPDPNSFHTLPTIMNYCHSSSSRGFRSWRPPLQTNFLPSFSILCIFLSILLHWHSFKHGNLLSIWIILLMAVLNKWAPFILRAFPLHNNIFSINFVY